jgi:hypothetical protein
VKKPEVCTHFEKLTQMRKQLAAMVKTPDEDDCIDRLFASHPSSHQLAINDVSATS